MVFEANTAVFWGGGKPVSLRGKYGGILGKYTRIWVNSLVLGTNTGILGSTGVFETSGILGNYSEILVKYSGI